MAQPNGTFGERIKQLRQAANMRQEDLARAIGTGKGRVSSWENDHDLPDAHRLPAIAKALNGDYKELAALHAVGAHETRLRSEVEAQRKLLEGLIAQVQAIGDMLSERDWHHTDEIPAAAPFAQWQLVRTIREAREVAVGTTARAESRAEPR